jgi:hypothetical protein
MSQRSFLRTSAAALPKARRLMRLILALVAMAFAGLLPLQPASAATGIDWTAGSGAEGDSWRSVAYGNGLFVAVSDSGTGNRVMTSPDGITWTIRTSAADNNWNSVAYGNGLFVAVSDSGTGNRVMTSPDGITWKIRTSAADNNWRSVTYGNGLFVAVSLDGTNNRVMTSPDGITWTSRTPAADNNWRSITYGNGLFVAVSNSGTGNRVMTSPDGITWTSRTSAVDNAWRGVTYGNGLFVAVSTDGTNNRVMTSPDGITWTSRTSAADNQWFSVTYGNGLFVAVSNSGIGNRVMTSPDGITWTSRTSAADTQWVHVTHGNGLFVAVGFDGTDLAMYSGSVCGDGLAYTVNQWRQMALPCVPSASPADVAGVLGNSPTANLVSANLGTTWSVFGRNATNSGNSSLFSSSKLANGAGYWLKSSEAPVSGTLNVAGVAATVTTGLTGCQSLVGCVVLPVNTTAAAARMFGNPFGYDVAWSQVRVRVGGSAGTIYTPSEAQTAGYLSKQIWIWNGSSYDTWDDTVTPGNLKYSQGFFIKVLAGGVGQTIDLLVPAASSTITGSLPQQLMDQMVSVSRSLAEAVVGMFVSPAHAQEKPKGWQVKLKVENPAQTMKAQAVLGQYPGSVVGYDAGDLNAMAPFAAPYLTLVFPRSAWGVSKGDYATDFRAFNGKPGEWTFEVRADRAGQPVVLRWEGDPQILKRSVLIDKISGKRISPASATSYSLTLNTSTRQFTWQYLGN